MHNQVGQCPSSTSMDSVEGSAVVDNNQYRIAVALYPGASLMNHSCDPNVINRFLSIRIILSQLASFSFLSSLRKTYIPRKDRLVTHSQTDIN